MALFNRKSKDSDNNREDGEEGKNSSKSGSKKPANTAFKQQRLKAWQPILTPKTVLPTLFIVGLVFAPIGGLLIWGSSQVSQITIDYTGCENSGVNFTDSAANFVNVPNWDYQLKAGDEKLPVNPPQWSFRSNPTATNALDRAQCRVRFDIPADLQPPVFIYYKLTNFYQNHRRYVQSQDSKQLSGEAVSANNIDGLCKPLNVDGNGKPIYPCGLIANSIFNDTFTGLKSVADNATYDFSSSGIAWPGEAKKYGQTKYNLQDISPPPNWAERYPGGYTAANPPPNFQTDEHFQNWMRTAGLPTFSKLYGRNDGTVLPKGTYDITIGDAFPVGKYGGTKSIVISTVAWIGGKNPFLGWAYVGAAGLFILLAIIGLAWHLIKPRRLGDMNLLSWNQPAQ
jgi:hypothetical protein